jgi:putative endonuclease
MPFYVYIIQSQADGSYYKGFSEDPGVRLQGHNRGESSYTKWKIPWTLVYVEQVDSKRNALIREKSLKKYSHEQIKHLIESPKNMVSRLL